MEKETEHNAQTQAKHKEQALLEGPPPNGLGRTCVICGNRFWKTRFYGHVDLHLDDINRGHLLKEIRELQEVKINA